MQITRRRSEGLLDLDRALQRAPLIFCCLTTGAGKQKKKKKKLTASQNSRRQAIINLLGHRAEKSCSELAYHYCPPPSHPIPSRPSAPPKKKERTEKTQLISSSSSQLHKGGGGGRGSRHKTPRKPTPMMGSGAEPSTVACSAAQTHRRERLPE